MAILRPLNEFTRESVVLALEPSRQCACHCSYCFAALNSKAQHKGKTKDLSDPSTFESTITKAFGPNYNPEDFLQWAVRNKMVLGFANTVEPFQDVDQARAILRTCHGYDLPLFIQTKGYNFFDVWDFLRPFHDNAVLFVSFPTMDDRVLRRFEAGTPLAMDRLRVISEAAKAGFHVILALSPYHEEWCEDPAAFIRTAEQAGVKSVFFDRGHLNRRQRSVSKDDVMKNLFHSSEHPHWPEKAIDHYRIIYETCAELELPIFASDWTTIHFGMPSTLPTISPDGVYSRGFQWPYHDGHLFWNLNHEFDSEAFDPDTYNGENSIVIEWSDVLSLMEDPVGVDQLFSHSSLSDLITVKEMPAVWRQLLKPKAPIREYYRALWNNPTGNGFAWRHPFSRVAHQPDGSPWTDDDGNLIMIFDPYYGFMDPGHERTVDSLDNFRCLTEAEND